MGDRLHHVIPLAVYRAASALLLLSPYTPMLWMGQEWAASTPFQYFTDHPPELGRLVTAGRREEFGAFAAFSDPAARERIPDPQAEETFVRSKLRWDERTTAPHAGVLALYRELLALRRAEPALRTADRGRFAATEIGERALALRRSSPDGADVLVVVNFGDQVGADDVGAALGGDPVTRVPEGARWARVVSTEEARFGGSEPPGDGGSLAVPAPGALVLRAVRDGAGATA
jgi:maltooligosyltrehalose trehalohydrolase